MEFEGNAWSLGHFSQALYQEDKQPRQQASFPFLSAAAKQKESMKPRDEVADNENNAFNQPEQRTRAVDSRSRGRVLLAQAGPDASIENPRALHTDVASAPERTLQIWPAFAETVPLSTLENDAIPSLAESSTTSSQVTNRANTQSHPGTTQGQQHQQWNSVVLARREPELPVSLDMTSVIPESDSMCFFDEDRL
ncbi:hypothetical protein K435DRAFT_866856 [Dendrothele bispora CBS 962.96]|uniref:Uncharacterized protein n=1 Tax=Dendrothele bispora (strain CBS 962.96) TaxID=1314807 RepID=A0A4S8LFT6_DENBC|nr:hypothetical protein K435DRAFT_866856 [Dendrothele bispora CBS 962.96]